MVSRLAFVEGPLGTALQPDAGEIDSVNVPISRAILPHRLSLVILDRERWRGMSDAAGSNTGFAESGAISHTRLPRSEIYLERGDSFSLSSGLDQEKIPRDYSTVYQEKSAENERYWGDTRLRTASVCRDSLYLCNARGAALYSNHLSRWLVQAVQALPGINEIMALDKELLIL